MAPFDEHEDIVAELEPVFAEAASITEQSDAFARFDLTGGVPAALVERLCPLDARSMKPGDAGRSVIEHVGCHLLCLAPDHFAVLGAPLVRRLPPPRAGECGKEPRCRRCTFLIVRTPRRFAGELDTDQ